MAPTIPSGVYFGFTLAELNTELDRYKESVKLIGSSLAAASQNGQSYTFGPRQDLSLAEWQLALQDALSYFGTVEPPPTTNEVVQFGAAPYRRTAMLG